MNKRRLLKLADLLEADAANKKGIKFDLGTWGETKDEQPSVSCKTTACAMGLAAVSGAFKRAGLSYRMQPRCSCPVCVDSPQEMTVSFNGREGGIWAACRLFDITQEASNWLFLPSGYEDLPTKGARGERAVAKRIRDFVAGKAAPPAE